MHNTFFSRLPIKLYVLSSCLIACACYLTRQWQVFTQWDLIVCVVINALTWALIPQSVLNPLHISRMLLLDTVYIGAFIALDQGIWQPAHILMASALGGLIYLISNRFLAGLGGRLGTQAFLTCTILVGIDACWSLF